MERIKVKDAASVLGVSEQYVRIGLQRGTLPIGSCVKISSVYTYHISPYLLEQYIGRGGNPVKRQKGIINDSEKTNSA